MDLKGFAPKYFLTLQKLPVCSRLILKRVHLLCGHGCPSLAVAASSVAPNGARLLAPSPANSPEQDRCVWVGTGCLGLCPWASYTLARGGGSEGGQGKRNLFLHPFPTGTGMNPSGRHSGGCNPRGIPCLWEIEPMLGMLRGP